MTRINKAHISIIRADVIERARESAEVWSGDIALAKQAAESRISYLEQAVSQQNQTVEILSAQLAALKV